MYRVIIQSKAFPECFFVIIKTTLQSLSPDIVIDDFCEAWEVGQLMGGN